MSSLYIFFIQKTRLNCTLWSNEASNGTNHRSSLTGSLPQLRAWWGGLTLEASFHHKERGSGASPHFAEACAARAECPWLAETGSGACPQRGDTAVALPSCRVHC